MESNRFSDKGPEFGEQKPKQYPFWQLDQPVAFELWVADQIIEARRENEGKDVSFEDVLRYIESTYSGLVLDDRQKAELLSQLDLGNGYDIYPGW